MIAGLADAPRMILKAQLAPVLGSTFQPTGFPDLGPAEFERPISNGDGEPSTQRALLVESVQSLANHLEATAWDATEHRPRAPLEKLPYVEVRNPEGRFLTSSRIEPHRLAGAYIKKASIDGKPVGEWMIERFGVTEGVPVDWRAIYAAIFALDPLCLVHGAFFSDKSWNVHGNPKVRRATTAVIEAHGARPVVSGGVKRDDVNPTHGESRTSEEGFGFVPFGRTEYTADSIELAIAIDLEQIRGYGLGEAATDLLTAVALWEVRTLLDNPLRLRTACDLEVEAVEVTRPQGWELPSAETLAGEIADSKAGFEHEGPYTTEFE